MTGRTIEWKGEKREVKASGKILLLSTKEIHKEMREGRIRSSKDVGLYAIGSMQMTCTDMEGESAESNLALAIIEKAIDWQLGLWITSWMKKRIKDGFHSKCVVIVNCKGLYDPFTGNQMIKW